jgi:hypothetical protein
VFVSVALIAQLPPIAFGIFELGGFPSCLGSAWLLGALVFGVFNIAAAFYLAIRIRNTEDPSLQHLHTALKRATYLLCHDPWMAIYILILIAFFAFLCIGASWKWSGKMDEDESCSDTVSGRTSTALLFGWFFIFGGSTALAMSICCACCDQRDYGATTNNNNNTPATPNPDVENPNTQQNAGSYTTQEPQPTTYSSHGYPVDPNEPEIPVAYAEAIPTPMPPPNSSQKTAPSAPPADFDSKPAGTASGTKGSEQKEEEGQSGTAGNLGSNMGKTVGKLFKVDETKQKDLENKGKKAGDAVGKGFLSATNFVKSKMNKKNQGGADNNNKMG